MYRVVRQFRDGNPNAQGHIYNVGDMYPFDKYTGAATKERLAELMNEDGPNDSFDGPVIIETDE